MITDFSLWENFEFQDLLPSWLEARKGLDSAQTPILVLYSPSHEKYCSVLANDVSAETVQVMVNNLVGAVFEKEFPDEMGDFIRNEAEAVFAGKPLAAKFAHMKERLNKLAKVTKVTLH